MRVLILKGDAPRHEYFASQIEKLSGVETLSLTPKRLGASRLRKMLFKQPKTFLARVGKYAIYNLMRWTGREEDFFKASSEEIDSSIHKRANIESLNSLEAVEIARNFEPDMIAAFGIPIISDELINVPKWGAVNLHGGISPEYKGGNTIFWPLLQGKSDMAGATIHYMVAKVDSGRILAKVYPELDAKDDECSASCKTFKDATAEFCTLIRWAESHGGLPEGKPQKGESHLYKAVDRGLWVSIFGWFGIRRRMRGVHLPSRVERCYD